MRIILITFFILFLNLAKSQIKGIDVSRYQGHIDWSGVDTSIKFVIAKKSEGVSIEDPKWCHNLLTCGRPFGLYHFFRSQFSGVEQARKFLTGFHISDIHILPVIDVELTRVWHKDGAKNLREMIQFIKDSIGVWPIIYTNNHFWNSKLCERVDLGGSKLWISDWRAAQTPQIPFDFSDWVIWQWTSKGRVSGISGYVDINFVKDLGDILISK